MYLETKSVRQVENFNLDWFSAIQIVILHRESHRQRTSGRLNCPMTGVWNTLLMKMQIPVVPVGMWKQGWDGIGKFSE